MEYIYNFIEYINESNLFSIATSLLILIYLIIQYTKKEDEENYLPLKIIGFYFLGGFNFNFKINWFVLPIPVGFLIYHIAMKEKERPNPTIKYKAAVLGVIMMFVGMINGMIYEKVEYRERTIKVENLKFENLEDEYKLIKNKFKIDYANLEAMQLDYDNSGKIQHLNYTLSDDKNIYYIYYANETYKINVVPTNANGFMYFGGYGSYYDAKEIFKMISNAKFETYDNATSYSIIFRGSKDYYENVDFYSINQETYSIKNLEDIWSVEYATGIVYNVYLNPTEEDKEGFKNQMYLLDYGNVKYQEDYDDVEIVSIKNNETVLITDDKIIKSIYEATMKEYNNWAPVTDLEITLEPNLYVKLSDEKIVGLCEEEPFIRVDEGDVSIWYIASSDIYTFIINRYFDASRAEAMYNN